MVEALSDEKIRELRSLINKEKSTKALPLITSNSGAGMKKMIRLKSNTMNVSPPRLG